MHKRSQHHISQSIRQSQLIQLSFIFKAVARALSRQAFRAFFRLIKLIRECPKVFVETGPCRSQTPTQVPSVNSANVTKLRIDGPGWGYVFSITRRDGLGYMGSLWDSKTMLQFGNLGLGEASALGV